MYFTLQRIITFIVGIAILYLAFLSYLNGNILLLILSFVLGIIGIYVVIASLIPYKATTKGVAEIVYEGLINFVLEILIRGFFRLIMKAFDH